MVDTTMGRCHSWFQAWNRFPSSTRLDRRFKLNRGSEKLKILIVEDEPLFSEMLRIALAAEPGLEVVGVVSDGESAVEMAAERNPDAVIMDIELPGEMDGIDAALKIKERRLDTGIVILSVHKDRRYVSSLPLSETHGWAYLLKQNVPDLASVLRAIQGSVDGMVVLDPEVVESYSPNEAPRPPG